MQTQNATARVPEELMTATRRAIGAPDDMRTADVIRHGLCTLTGLDPEAYTPRKTGRPRKVRAA